MNEDDDSFAPVDQPPLKDVPADEQHVYARATPTSPWPRLMVLAGAGLFAAAVLAWKRMGLDFPYEGWQRFLPAMAFMSALSGVCLVFYGIYLTLLEPPPEVAGHRFAAWGRFGMGVAFTVIGIVAKNLIVVKRNAPPEALAVATMCMIVGPVLCAWACYGTFVKDRSQRDTGFLMIAAIASFLALLLWG